MATFWRDVDRSPVGVEEAMGEWTLAAWQVLEDAAHVWRKTVSEERLGVEVQRRSDIHTALPVATWIGPVISLVAQRAHEEHGPVLTSLVVDDRGHVPESYREVVRLQGGGELGEAALEDHALDARLTCYRAYGARVPAGVTELPRSRRATVAAASVRRASGGSAHRAEEKPAFTPSFCPTCWLQLPLSGQCDNCA